MIDMESYYQIVKLRNQGLSQKQISEELGISRKTIGRYLREGRIPHYYRKSRTRKDVFCEYQVKVEEILNRVPTMDTRELYRILREEGYKGSYRTLCRKTEAARNKLKKSSCYFEREKMPGQIMEGDFTTLKDVCIGGSLVDVKLWVVVLLFSNHIFATPFSR